MTTGDVYDVQLGRHDGSEVILSSRFTWLKVHFLTKGMTFLSHTLLNCLDSTPPGGSWTRWPP